MTTNKLSFDFSDSPELVEMLRLEAIRTNSSLNVVLVKALESYFANKLETSLLTKAADQVFKEWDNEEDSIYDSY